MEQSADDIPLEELTLHDDDQATSSLLTHIIVDEDFQTNLKDEKQLKLKPLVHGLVHGRYGTFKKILKHGNHVHALHF